MYKFRIKYVFFTFTNKKIEKYCEIKDHALVILYCYLKI